ncbi:MAG: pilus assembly protein PilP [Thermodesulfovibrionales bacterium]
MSRTFITALALVCAVSLASPVLSGPGTPQPATPLPGKTPEKSPGKTQETAPEKAKEEISAGPYDYSAKDRRDPFVPLIRKAEQEKKRVLAPMERYASEEVKLVAVLWSGKGYYALITLPDGKSYTLREGTKLGPNGGKVLRISRDSVVIREQIKDYRGAVSPRDITLKLRREEEG